MALRLLSLCSSNNPLSHGVLFLERAKVICQDTLLDESHQLIRVIVVEEPPHSEVLAKAVPSRPQLKVAPTSSLTF